MLVLAFVLALETGANGSTRPETSAVIGVAKSINDKNRGSENIVVVNDIGCSSLTSLWNWVCDWLSIGDVDKGGWLPVSVKKYQYAIATTISATGMMIIVLDFMINFIYN
jgi:hypothetical protein